jgi:hypothetical protein
MDSVIYLSPNLALDARFLVSNLLDRLIQTSQFFKNKSPANSRYLHKIFKFNRYTIS